MILLGIESSCDETAAALVEDGRKILSSVVASQVEEHKIYGGVVPEIASRRHSEAIVGVVKEALEQGGKTLSEIDGIAVTYAPGLIGALLVNQYYLSVGGHKARPYGTVFNEEWVQLQIDNYSFEPGNTGWKRWKFF